MDILKAEIARKRKQIEKAEVVAPNKKFFRRGDLAKKQQEEYWTKYYEKHGSDIASSSERRISEEEALKKLEDEELPRQEVIRRLRERSEPIRLFAENDQDTYKRLRKLELDVPDLKEGWTNDFQSAMDQVDQEYVNEVIQGLQNEEGRHDVKVDEKIVTIEEIMEMSKEIEDKPDKDTHGKECEMVYAWFNHLLQRWGKDLNARPENVKRSVQGKFESATHTQTVEHVKPLFKGLSNKSCADDIIVHLVLITKCMLERDYILANNAYMAMSIGNAPWPVGVTRSGVHQRPGSARMYVKNIAHVLNDETQRKFIQGLKRLMTKCQQYYPTDPSRSIDYVSKKDL